MNFIHFMASPAGRILRFLVGAILILVGLLAIGGVGGVILAIIGLAPLIAGTFDLCFLAPLFKLPLSGRRIRAETERTSP